MSQGEIHVQVIEWVLAKYYLGSMDGQPMPLLSVPHMLRGLLPMAERQQMGQKRRQVRVVEWEHGGNAPRGIGTLAISPWQG